MRPRLLRALLCRWDVPVVCLEAGAGFGKSTILAQAYQENLLAPRGADAWLTCELADSSASALLAGIVTTLGGSVESDVDVTAAAEAIWSASPVEVAVLLDDVHLIEPGSPGEAALAGLVEALPANGHLVIAGRRLPDLPLARLAAQQRLVRITDDDLRFTAEELREYAENAAVDVGRLEPAAGWPALIALRASARSDDSRAFVLEEVVAALDPAVRRTLAIAALIGGGDAALLSAAARDEVDLDAFREIPLVACTPEGNVHVHAMWSDLLVSELDDAQRIEARRAAAELLAARGSYGEAFELLAASGFWVEARSALLEACTDQVQPAPPEQLRRWRRMAPEAEIGAGPAAYIDALVARADAPWSAEARDHFAARDRGVRGGRRHPQRAPRPSRARATRPGSVRTSRCSPTRCSGTTSSAIASPASRS